MADQFEKHGLGFKKMCKLKSSETAVFAFIIYKSKAHRDRVNKKVMAEMTGPPPEMPFSMNRFSMAGFKAIVQASRRKS